MARHLVNHRARPIVGFTLIEMMVVIVIMGLVLALIVSRGPAHSATLTLRAIASEMAGALRTARSDAIIRGVALPFRIDPSLRTFGAPGSAYVLPPGVTMSVITRPPGRIVFQPDGSASSGAINLILGTLSISVTIDWLTGGVDISPVHAFVQK